VLLASSSGRQAAPPARHGPVLPGVALQPLLGASGDLTADELDYLTELDGVDHFALGALATDAEGQAQGVGVARFVRFGDETDSAEPTVAIVDEYQGRGWAPSSSRG